MLVFFFENVFLFEKYISSSTAVNRIGLYQPHFKYFGSNPFMSEELLNLKFLRQKKLPKKYDKKGL